MIMWGNHDLAGDIIETGKVTSLLEADTAEVIVGDGKKKAQTHVDVNYTMGDQTFKTRVKRGATIAEFREKSFSFVEVFSPSGRSFLLHDHGGRRTQERSWRRHGQRFPRTEAATK
jgi:hypothetical protein